MWGCCDNRRSKLCMVVSMQGWHKRQQHKEPSMVTASAWVSMTRYYVMLLYNTGYNWYYVMLLYNTGYNCPATTLHNIYS